MASCRPENASDWHENPYRDKTPRILAAINELPPSPECVYLLGEACALISELTVLLDQPKPCYDELMNSLD
jgi:hypothetical protein